jgi:hypothetical protein
MRIALLAFLMISSAADAGAAPANTLRELFAQIDDCIGPLRLHSETEMSIRFSLRRDGSLIGKPRVTYLQTPKDESNRDEDLGTVAAAFNRCLPARITPALGGAIAGQPFTFSFLPAKHEQKA